MSELCLITGFDAFGYGAEDKLFCAADGAPVHFSRSLADVLTANDARYRTLSGYTDYTAAFATAASEDVARRVAMLSPFHYLAQYRADSTSVRPSPHFRLTVGTADSNASPTAVNVKQHAEIVLEKSLMRSLIDNGSAIAWCIQNAH